jgi:eukaryotic-like serine/threonine-protein kinase
MSKLGKFEILEKIGQGAMGVVYKARDPIIGRTVALKTLTTDLSEDPNLLKRFYSEARAAGGLQHPNIVTIYELGHEGNTPFIVMQFLSGESLDKLISRRPSTHQSQKIGSIVHVCRALDYAHKQNPPVIHRDIKPGNVMVTTEGTVMVVDFGIARLGEGTRSQSAGMLIGTLAYMAPELFRGSSADARSDIWAAGVMLYELLAYERPFNGSTAAALISNIIMEKPRAISKAAPNTPPDVVAVLDRMLCKEIDGRYQSMEEVLMELEPAWRRLQETDVANLVATSRELFAAGNLANAQDNLRRALQIDTSNTQAKSLLERINAEIRRNQIIPQLKVRVEKARELFAAGQLEDALAEAQAIMREDSTFQPARELFERAQMAVEHAHSISEAVRGLRQRLAEGALADAEIQLDKVLEMDPGNAIAQDLAKQIRAEKTRRELKKRRDELLHSARTLWTNLQYEDCIEVLVPAQRRFPGDPEIINLLETARRDQAEQQRQTLLAEIRNLVSTQRFDEALGALDSLLERHPADSVAASLRAHALQGKAQQTKEQRLREEKSKLQAWLKAGKYQEVIAGGEKLAKEFSDDFEFHELLDFARTEQFRLDKEQRLRQWLERIRQAIKDNRFSEAIQVAQKALGEFSQNVDVLILLERAKSEQSEREKHELLKQRLREVEKKIERDELTDGIDLARQTLATVGHDPRIADILEKAETELKFRREKERHQDETLQRARTLLQEGKFSDATSLVEFATVTQLFSAGDSRVRILLDEIGIAEKSSLASATLLNPPTDTPGTDPGKEYVFQRGASLPLPPLPADQKAAAAAGAGASAGTAATSAHRIEPQPIVPDRMIGTPTTEVADNSSVAATRRSTLRRRIFLFLLGAVLAGIGAKVFIPVSQPSEEEKRLWAQAQHSANQDPRHLNEAIATYQRIVDMKRAFAKSAKSEISNLQTLQREENDWIQKGRAAQERGRDGYEEALNDYKNAVGINGDRQKEAEEALQNLKDHPPGMSQSEIARADFSRARSLAKDKQWEGAKAAYQQVLDNQAASPELLKPAADGLKDASNHVHEQDLWNNVLHASSTAEARRFAQQVIALNLDHQNEARELINKIDRANSEARGDQEYTDLRRETDQAERAADENALKNLQSRARNIGSSNGKHAAEALQIATSEIPAFLENIRKAAAIKNEMQRARTLIQGGASGRFGEAMKVANDMAQQGMDANSLRQEVLDAESRALQSLQNDYKNADKKNASELKILRERALLFKSNANQPRDVEPLLNSIDNAVVAAGQPSTPPVTGPTDTTSSDGSPPRTAVLRTDQAKISQLLDSYAQAFETKDVVQLRHVWPTLTDKQFKDNVDALRGADSIHITIQKNSISVTDLTAVANCVQTWEVKSQGATQRFSRAATFMLRRLRSGDGDWVIERVTVDKIR